jgi:tetratricopeptide (TPR) repeat protein
MKPVEKRILATATEHLQDCLSTLTQDELLQAEDILSLLWLVHPDTKIKEVSKDILSSFLTEQQLDRQADKLSIFSSIVDFLPWMGDYNLLQQQNFQKLMRYRVRFEALLVSDLLVEVYLDLGRKLYMMFHLEEEARSCFEAIIKGNSACDEALYALGRIEEKQGQLSAAKELYEQCIGLNAKHIYAHLQLGFIKAKLDKNYLGAAEHYEIVVDLEPFMIEAYVRAAAVYYSMLQVKRALQFIEIALGINEYHDETLELLARIQWQHQNDPDKAIVTLNKGLDHPIHGDSSLLLASLGSLYNDHFADYEKAKSYYEKSLKLKPNQEAVLHKLIQIYLDFYQDLGAIATCYEQFLNVEKNKAKVFVDYAAFLAKYLQDYDFAAIQLQEALSIEPQNLEAKQLLEQLQAQAQNTIAYEEQEEEEEYEGGGAPDDN